MDEDEEVRQAVAVALAALDTTVRNPRWRYRVAGPMGDAIAMTDDRTTVKLRIPLPEMRVVRDLAAQRGLKAETMIRRAVGSWICAVSELTPTDIPYLTSGGLIR